MHSDDPGLLAGSDSVGGYREAGVCIFNKLLGDAAAAVCAHISSSDWQEKMFLVWIFLLKQIILNYEGRYGRELEGGIEGSFHCSHKSYTCGISRPIGLVSFRVSSVNPIKR